jgi:hypothetical protein
VGEAREVGVHHHLNKALEIDRRRPAERLTRPRRIANQMIDLGGTQEARIHADVLLPIEADVLEGSLDQLAHGSTRRRARA